MTREEVLVACVGSVFLFTCVSILLTHIRTSRVEEKIARLKGSIVVLEAVVPKLCYQVYSRDLKEARPGKELVEILSELGIPAPKTCEEKKP